MLIFRVFFRYLKPIFCILVFSFCSIFMGTVTARPNPNEKLVSLEANIFGAIRYSAFLYEGHYVNPDVIDRGEFHFQNFANNTSKNGYTGGGEIGVFRTFRNSFDYGIFLSGVGPSDKSILINHVDADSPTAETGWVDITNRFKVKYQFDLALMFGINLTPRAFTYVKVGPSYTSIDQITNLYSYANTVKEVAYSSYDNNNKKWGGVFGLGMKYFFNNRIGVFAEYDYYDYARITIPTIKPVNSDLGPDTALMQKIKPKFGSLRFGLSINLY